MARGNEAKELEAELAPLRAKVEAWRRGAKGANRRMPEGLWEEASEAAIRHGVGAVSYRLGLGYYRLEARVKVRAQRKKSAREVATFVELMPSRQRPSNKIEIEKSNGSKLRIEFDGCLSQELCRLSELLWRAAK